MDLSSGFGQTFPPVKWAQDMVAAFVRPRRATNPPRQEHPARAGFGSDKAAAATAAELSIRADAACPATTRDTTGLWRAIDLDVSAVIGHRGTAAVLRRAVAMARRTHGWLPETSEDSSFDACVDCLEGALDERGIEEAGSARLAVQVAFRGLLASLVGTALAEQLLGAAWTPAQARGESVP